MDEVDVFIVVVVSGRDTDDRVMVTVGVISVGTVIVVEDICDDFDVNEAGVSAFVDEIDCVVDKIDAAVDLDEHGVDSFVEEASVVIGVDAVWVVIEGDVGEAVVDDNEDCVSLVDEVDILSVVRSIGVITLCDEVGVDIVVSCDTAMDTDDSCKVGIVFVVDDVCISRVVAGVVFIILVENSEVGGFVAVTDVDGSDGSEVEVVGEIGIIADDVCVSRVVAGAVFVILVENSEVVFKVDELDANRSEDGTAVIVSVVVGAIVPVEEVGVVIIKAEVSAVFLVVKAAVVVSRGSEVVTVLEDASEDKVVVVVIKDEAVGAVSDIISDVRGEVLSVDFAIDGIGVVDVLLEDEVVARVFVAVVAEVSDFVVCSHVPSLL